jgi:hypothetical protein
VEQKLVVDKPEAIAHFLLTTPKLDAALVGEYISEPYAPRFPVPFLSFLFNDDSRFSFFFVL